MSKAPFTQVQVLIEKFSSKGYGVGSASKAGGLPMHKVEVPHTVPGDTVHVLIGRKRKGAFFGFSPEVITPSEGRVETRCIHASVCGGCSWQQVSYLRQIREKQKFVENLFSSCRDPATIVHPIFTV